MSSQLIKVECPLHNSEAIAINLDPNIQLPEMLQCIYCLVGSTSRSIVPLRDIKNILENFVTLQQQKSDEINQLKRTYLMQLLDNLCKMKQEINNFIDNGINIIQTQLQIDKQEEEEVMKNVESEVIGFNQQVKQIIEYQYSYCQQQKLLNELNWTQPLSEVLQQINNFEGIQNCLDLLRDLKNEYQMKNEINIVGKLLLIESDPEILRGSSSETPKLNIVCQQHQKEIIMIDMNENIEKSMRLCCIECMPETYWSLTKCKEKWKTFEQKKRAYLQQQIFDMEAQYEQIRDQNKKIEQQIIEQLKGVRVQFEDILAINKRKILSNINMVNEDWINLSQDDILERVEILIKNEESQNQMIHSEYQQFSDYALKLLQEQVKELKVQQQNLYDNLRSTLCHSQEISKSASSSDQNCLNDIYYQINEIGSSSKNTQKLQELIQIQSYDIGSDLIKKNQRKENDSAFSSPKNNGYEDIQIDKENMDFEEKQPIQYQIISKYQQVQNCYAISVNFDQTIMISGCSNDIAIWEFNNGKIKHIQNLQGHSNQVISLQFSVDKNEFVSGSTDKSIRYWQLINNIWLCKQVLLGHKRQIDCLLMSNNNHQIISCSCDKTIRIWRKNQQSLWFQVQTLTNHSAYVRCISLSKSQNLLVSCGEDKMILIWELNKSKVWNLKQSIKNDDFGYRICFMDDIKIAWQPRSQNKTYFYEYDTKTNQFELDKHHIMLQYSSEGYQNFFPSIYNEQKQVLINKHGQFVYIMKMNESHSLEISQVINIGHYCNYGSLTNDGQFLVIWDEKSKCLQVRQATF
ncbi:unnamed protein product [Paramecium octaurelia]|uniref:WD domain, G-beta repeat protein n=1 Tax=Paramecium octaurelia TaxID=43137 RepID=A0A8S1W8X7_PAROT|nr:unnamed protein product [Paramecium octaurelia]